MASLAWSVLARWACYRRLQEGRPTRLQQKRGESHLTGYSKLVPFLLLNLILYLTDPSQP